MRFARGDDHVRDALRESGVSAANVVAVVGDGTFGSRELRAKYVQLCRKLDMRDSLLGKNMSNGPMVSPLSIRVVHLIRKWVELT